MVARTKSNLMVECEEIIDILNHVLEDVIIKKKFTFNFYKYLSSEHISAKVMGEFNSCSFISTLKFQIEEFDDFLKGGNSFLREAYPDHTKPEVRKIKEYLEGLIENGRQYEAAKRKRRPYTKRKVAAK